MIRLARTIHFNAGRSLWRADWTAGEESRGLRRGEPARVRPQLRARVAVEGEIDPETAMVVNLTDLDRILQEEVDRPLDHRT